MQATPLHFQGKFQVKTYDMQNRTGSTLGAVESSELDRFLLHLKTTYGVTPKSSVDGNTRTIQLIKPMESENPDAPPELLEKQADEHLTSWFRSKQAHFVDYQA